MEKGIWYENPIKFISAREITLGTGEGKFSPEKKLTRGQFITMLMRAYSIEANNDPRDNFSDAGDTWYTAYLGAAKELGISNGVGNNMFAPNKEITRQEMFTLLYNTLKTVNQLTEIKEKAKGSNQGKQLLEFADENQIASWARESMKLMVETGNIKGSGGKLAPLGITTRAEMAQVLYNLIKR